MTQTLKGFRGQVAINIILCTLLNHVSSNSRAKIKLLNADVPFYYTFVFMLFSWVRDPPRDVCICCCAYLRSYYSTVVILHYSTEFNVYCTYVIGTVLLLSVEYYTFAEYGDMMLLYGEARPSFAHSPSFQSLRLRHSSFWFSKLSSLHLRHSSFSNPSLALPTSQLILQLFRCFTYVTVHSPTLLSPLLRHRIFTYVTWRAAHDIGKIGPSEFP